MIVERLTFQAHYGRGDELVAIFRDSRKLFDSLAGESPPMRLYTDRTGTMFTIIVDTEFPDFETFARFEAKATEMYGDPKFEEWFAKTQPLVAKGERQLLNMENI